MSDSYSPAYFAAEAMARLQFLNEIGGPEGADFIAAVRLIQSELTAWEHACMAIIREEASHV